jgi:hypothetical protein
MDETEKRRRLARELVQTCGGLMDVLYHLNGLRMRAGNLTFVEADFTGVSGLEHLTKARVDSGVTTINTVLTAFVSNNFDDVFEALRS